MNCFACGEPLKNVSLPCPKCEYKFQDDMDKMCPNMQVGGICAISEELCSIRGNYNLCPTKQEAESNSII